MNTLIKEKLEPPFIYGDGYKWDWDTYHIRADIDGDETAILKVMPIAAHSYYRKRMGNKGWVDFIKELTQFTVQALTEKWERDFGESRTCPYCSRKKDYQLFCRGQEMNIEYCPFCGRLLPPEKEEAHND